jgi:protein-disulfide isomerase
MNKSFWIILTVAIVGLGAIFILSGGKASNSSSGEFAYTEPLINPQSHDHTVGAGNKATIVEYADFQCPACANYFPLLNQVKQTFGDDVKIIFRNFPITNSHPQAMAAHRAAEAASRQGKFWEMHDQLYATQQNWSGNTSAVSVFESYAQELGLNMDQYRSDVNSDSVMAKISSDMESAGKLGVNATPTIFLNGQKLENLPTSIDEWQSLINGDTQQSQE